MGSWPFVFGFLLVMAGWAATNTFFFVRVLHHKAFDPYPYILLNLFLSMLAGLQGAILLIAAKRADQVAAEQALHHLSISENTDTIAAELRAQLKTNTALTAEVHALSVHIHELVGGKT